MSVWHTASVPRRCHVVRHLGTIKHSQPVLAKDFANSGHGSLREARVRRRVEVADVRPASPPSTTPRTNSQRVTDALAMFPPPAPQPEHGAPSVDPTFGTPWVTPLTSLGCRVERGPICRTFACRSGHRRAEAGDARSRTHRRSMTVRSLPLVRALPLRFATLVWSSSAISSSDRNSRPANSAGRSKGYGMSKGTAKTAPARRCPLATRARRPKEPIPRLVFCQYVATSFRDRTHDRVSRRGATLTRAPARVRSSRFTVRGRDDTPVAATWLQPRRSVCPESHRVRFP